MASIPSLIQTVFLNAYSFFQIILLCLAPEMLIFAIVGSAGSLYGFSPIIFNVYLWACYLWGSFFSDKLLSYILWLWKYSRWLDKHVSTLLYFCMQIKDNMIGDPFQESLSV